MKKYSLDHINHQIIATKSFMKAAGIVGSADYKEMLKLRREMPDYEIVERTITRNPNKQSYQNLSFERMKTLHTFLMKECTIDYQCRKLPSRKGK